MDPCIKQHILPCYCDHQMLAFTIVHVCIWLGRVRVIRFYWYTGYQRMFFYGRVTWEQRLKAALN